jgi:hypothetical protein
VLDLLRGPDPFVGEARNGFRDGPAGPSGGKISCRERQDDDEGTDRCSEGHEGFLSGAVIERLRLENIIS